MYEEFFGACPSCPPAGCPADCRGMVRLSLCSHSRAAPPPLRPWRLALSPGWRGTDALHTARTPAGSRFRNGEDLLKSGGSLVAVQPLGEGTPPCQALRANPAPPRRLPPQQGALPGAAPATLRRGLAPRAPDHGQVLGCVSAVRTLAHPRLGPGWQSRCLLVF